MPDVAPRSSVSSVSLLTRSCSSIVRPAHFRLPAIGKDWLLKTQGVWAQDFPLKSAAAAAAGSTAVADRPSCDFEEQLVAYFTACGGIDARLLRHYDFSAAVGQLVASVPGTHTNQNPGGLRQWGFPRLRAVLEAQPADARQADGTPCKRHNPPRRFAKRAAAQLRLQSWLTCVLGRSVGPCSLSPARLPVLVPGRPHRGLSGQGLDRVHDGGPGPALGGPAARAVRAARPAHARMAKVRGA